MEERMVRIASFRLGSEMREDSGKIGKRRGVDFVKGKKKHGNMWWCMREESGRRRRKDSGDFGRKRRRMDEKVIS